MGCATRDLQKEAVWRRRLRQQSGSGQSVRAWCRRQGVTESLFYWWRRELARRELAGSLDSAASFVPVHVTGEPERDSGQPHTDQRVGAWPIERDGAASMEIVLTDGRRVRLTGPVDQRRLIALLEALVVTDATVAERRSC